MNHPLTTFSSRVMAFYESLRLYVRLPAGIDTLLPLENETAMKTCREFYDRYFSDQHPRMYILGINPGRFGAGMTGITFTDPLNLATKCGIPNQLSKKHELSSVFIYGVISAYGGCEAFYQKYFLSAVCPLGFTRNGINLNYYDDRQLQHMLKEFILDSLRQQLDFGADRKACICLGEGKNFDYLSRLNETHGLFGKIIPLPHPRWIMQYRRKQMNLYIDKYLALLQSIEAGPSD